MGPLSSGLLVGHLVAIERGRMDGVGKEETKATAVDLGQRRMSDPGGERIGKMKRKGKSIKGKPSADSTGLLSSLGRRVERK